MRSLCGVWCVLVAACGFNPVGDGAGDDAVDRDAFVDADEGDGAPVDGAEIDAAAIDAAAIDARIVDARVLDARVDAATDAAVDAAIDARPPCPAAYDVQFQGSNYRFEPIAQVWTVAAVDCNGDLSGRTHLATFEVASDMDGAIAAVNPGNGAEPLVGASCAANDCSTMNAWSWVTGTDVSTMVWEPGQPDNGTTEKAGAAIRDMGTWKLRNVTTSLTTRPYICECDP
jgi:hypothetical protein